MRESTVCPLKGDTALASDYVSSDFVEHLGPPGLPGGIEGSVALVNLFRNSFPDYRCEIEEMLADDDKVLVRGVVVADLK